MPSFLLKILVSCLIAPYMVIHTLHQLFSYYQVKNLITSSTFSASSSLSPSVSLSLSLLLLPLHSFLPSLLLPFFFPFFLSSFLFPPFLYSILHFYQLLHRILRGLISNLLFCHLPE